MAQPKVKFVALLRHSESDGLQFPLTVGDRGVSKTIWLEVIQPPVNWPALKKTDDRDAYYRALHADADYRVACNRFMQLQAQDPQPVMESLWAFRGGIYVVRQPEGEQAIGPEVAVLLVKRYVLRRDRDHRKIHREVETLENLEKIESSSREAIPEAVRLFVWQRDKGRCVKCGSQQHLEFDHIIPVSRGGSNTERNIQLLCELCNRSKGATI